MTTLSRGDVVTHRGDFALVWDCPGRYIRVFPIASAEDGTQLYDVVLPSWPAFAEPSRIYDPVVRLSEPMWFVPKSWHRVHAAQLDAHRVGLVEFAVDYLAFLVGPQMEWTHAGAGPDYKAPIFAS